MARSRALKSTGATHVAVLIGGAPQHRVWGKQQSDRSIFEAIAR